MSIGQDLRHSFRAIAHKPGLAAVAILTVALGVGANTAIFSLVNGTLLRPLPFREPGRLVAVSEGSHALRQVGGHLVNGMHFSEWRTNVHSFEALALIAGISRNLTGSGEPERLIGGRVSASLFPMLGVRPQLGRVFREQEDQPGSDRVVILSHALWVRRFGADPGVLGRTIRLDSAPYQVIGVMPADLPQAGVNGVSWSRVPRDFWVPFGLRNDELYLYGDLDYECIARLKPGVSLAQAESEINAVQARIASAIPEKVDLEAQLTPLRDEITAGWHRALLVLLAAVATVLLIGCVNIANLLLARAAGRRREFAIRVAVGASRRHLIAQSMAESFVLAAIGGLFGLALTYASFGFLLAHAPADLPRVDEVNIDQRVLLFGVLITLLTGLFCGLLPAVRYTSVDPHQGLKAGSHSLTENRRALSIRSALVSAEIGLSTLCLIALGLLLHSFVNLMRVDRGFDVQRILTVDLSLPAPEYATPEQRTQFWQRLLPKLDTLPGVISVGIVNRLPLSGEGTDNQLIAEGSEKLAISQQPVADMRFVNPGYFHALGIPLQTGRIFSEADRQRRVAVLSTKTARRLFGSGESIGKRFHLGGAESPLITVVGIAGDVRAAGLNKNANLTLYLPYWQRDRAIMSLAIRTAIDPLAIASAVRQEIREIDPQLPVPQFRTMMQVLDASVAQKKFQVLLLGIFGGLALLLASLGVYGVVSYAVTQRTTEMGVRLALGAQPRDVSWLVLRQGMAPVIWGLIAGIGSAILAARILSSLLFGVTGRDPATLCGVVILLSAVAALACSIPVARATRIDPIQALRYE